MQGVLCNNDDHIIMTCNFEKMLFEISNFKINNVSKCVFSTDGVTCFIYVFCKICENVYIRSILKHFSIILR